MLCCKYITFYIKFQNLVTNFIRAPTNSTPKINNKIVVYISLDNTIFCWQAETYYAILDTELQYVLAFGSEKRSLSVCKYTLDIANCSTTSCHIECKIASSACCLYENCCSCRNYTIFYLIENNLRVCRIKSSCVSFNTIRNCSCKTEVKAIEVVIGCCKSIVLLYMNTCDKAKIQNEKKIINNLMGDSSICFSEHLTGHLIKPLLNLNRSSGKNVISWHDTIVSRHDTVISWHDTVVSRHTT